MKNPIQLTLLIMTILSIGCKEDTNQVNADERNVDAHLLESEHFEEILPFDSIPRATDLDIEKTQQIVLKRQSLIDKADDTEELGDLVINKRFKKDEDLYLIDFKYPYLNPKLKRSYQNFNEYLEDSYMDISGIEASILEDKELICDTLRINRFKEKRLVDYKIYNLNEKLISVLFYKENYYSGTLHPTYSFDCLNFDLNRSVFMNYEDFFVEGSEEEMTQILNEVLREKIDTGDIYYDCWEITFDNFFEYKDNFVIDDHKIEYYFDDCVICPSYTGTFSVEIPLQKVFPVLRRHQLNQLLL